MCKLIGDTESSFIPYRQALDIIFLAQEVIDTLKKKGKKGRMSIKIDLEKA